jgi:hypothetical protein
MWIILQLLPPFRVKYELFNKGLEFFKARQADVYGAPYQFSMVTAEGVNLKPSPYRPGQFVRAPGG